MEILEFLIIDLRLRGNFLEYDFGPYSRPSYIIFVNGSHMQHMDKIGHVAAAPGPLACPSRSALPRNCSQLIGGRGGGRGSKNRSLGQTRPRLSVNNQNYSTVFLSILQQ